MLGKMESLNILEHDGGHISEEGVAAAGGTRGEGEEQVGRPEAQQIGWNPGGRSGFVHLPEDGDAALRGCSPEPAGGEECGGGSKQSRAA